MDPVSVLVVALAQAFILGIPRGMGEAAGRDAYEALKKALLAGYDDVWPAVEQLQRDPGSYNQQEYLFNILRSRGAERDGNLRQLAERLLRAVQNTNSADQTEQLKRANGLRGVQEILDAHLAYLKRVRQDFNVEDTQLLSPYVSRAWGLPDHIRYQVRALHQRIRQYMHTSVYRANLGRYREPEVSQDAGLCSESGSSE